MPERTTPPMSPKNWTLVTGCSAFILVGAIAMLAGASAQTATFRAVVASFVGGLFGFGLDYFSAHSPKPRPTAAKASGPAEPRRSDFSEVEDLHDEAPE